jgi:hypothetical protein
MNKPAAGPDENSPILKKLPHAVVVLGFVSFLNDFASSDIVIPLIPILRATVLAAGRSPWD